MNRREWAAGSGLLLASLAGGCAWQRPAGAAQARFEGDVQAIERASGGRLGVAIRDTASGATSLWRGDERFPMCSTFKLLAAGFVLARVDRGQERLDRRVPIEAADLLSYAPATRAHVGGTMSVAQLCEAAVILSDNTAANLMLRSFGGPPALTAFARSLGDPATRLDRTEPDLNESLPGDPRDTTTPAAMLETVQKLVLGNALSPASRAQLQAWLLADQVGDHRLRAQLPPGWRVGDKTGTGEHGSTNDSGVLWPPGRPPVVVIAYLTGSSADGTVREHALAEVGRLAAALAADNTQHAGLL